jgi:hypothetical protein
MPRTTASQNYFHHSVQGIPALGISHEVGSYKEAMERRQSMRAAMEQATRAATEQATPDNAPLDTKNPKQAP